MYYESGQYEKRIRTSLFLNFYLTERSIIRKINRNIERKFS